MQLQSVNGVTATAPVAQAPAAPTAGKPIDPRTATLFGRDILTLTPSAKKDNSPINKVNLGDPDVDKYDALSVNYQQVDVQSGSKSDTMGGIQASRATDIWMPDDTLRMALEVNGELMGSGHSLAVGGGVGLKASVGSTMNVFGFGLPFGVYVKGGPALNVTDVKGDTSMGIGAEMSAGINILGLNVEMVKTMTTNVEETGFRIGVDVKF